MNAELLPLENTIHEQLESITLNRARNAMNDARLKIGRIAAAALIAVGASATTFTAQEAINPQSVAAYNASTGDYPWNNATVLNTATGDYGYENCPSDAPACKSKTYIKNGKTYGQYDAWNYYFRNCTSYVAWRLNYEFGVNASGLGNANTWDDRAPGKGWSVDKIPEVGDVAQWDTGNFGHVAFVEEIGTGANVGKVRVAEYNQQNNGNFRSDRWLAISAVGSFIDVNGSNPTGFALKLPNNPPPPNTSPTLTLIDHTDAVYGKPQVDTSQAGWIQQTNGGSAKAISVGGNRQSILDFCGAIYTRDGVGWGGAGPRKHLAVRPKSLLLAPTEQE